MNDITSRWVHFSAFSLKFMSNRSNSASGTPVLVTEITGTAAAIAGAGTAAAIAGAGAGAAIAGAGAGAATAGTGAFDTVACETPLDGLCPLVLATSGATGVAVAGATIVVAGIAVGLALPLPNPVNSQLELLTKRKATAPIMRIIVPIIR